MQANLTINVGISSCLLGERVRYDGGHKLDAYLAETLGKYIRWVPVCPEVECGLGVPRQAMHLVGTPVMPRLVEIRTGVDRTDMMLNWSRKKIAELSSAELCGFVFKSRSPSSGMRNVKIYNASGMPSGSGTGIFANQFMLAFPKLPVEDEGRLHNPTLRENFIERLFAVKRWQDFMKSAPNGKGLVAFHTEHKYLMLAHSPKHYSVLGKMVSGAGRKPSVKFLSDYFDTFIDGLSLLSTVKKNTNVLQHIAGYFGKILTSDEKQELQEVIFQYHDGHVPLIVPVTLLNHYVRKFDEPYLKRQLYLNPHPLELMLRNHV